MLVKHFFIKMNLEKLLKLLWKIEVERNSGKLHRNCVVRYKKMEFSVLTDS